VKGNAYENDNDDGDDHGKQNYYPSHSLLGCDIV
jgi:hypothetical protein